MNMPTVSSNDSKVKKKLFSLDSLLKINQSKSTTTTTTTTKKSTTKTVAAAEAKNSYNKSIQNPEPLNGHLQVDSAVAEIQNAFATRSKNDKMFLQDVSLSSLNAVNSRTIQSGHLRSKTSFYAVKKSNYFRLRQYGERAQVKIFLECYKDGSLKKVKYIVDLDNVDQIDLKEHLNTIYLSRSNKEYCTLEAPDKTHTMLWLNAICRHCGFNEIQSSYDTEQIPFEITNNKMNTIESDSRTLARLPVKRKTNLVGTTPAPTPNIKSKSMGPVLSSNKKVIAGIAATSVGSYDLNTGHLEKIFKKNTISELEQGNDQGSNTLKAFLYSRQPDSYIPLQDCVSGIDNKTQQSQYRLNKSESNAQPQQLQHTQCMESSDGMSQSLSSLERLNISSTKVDYDEDYSVFDLDIESNNKQSELQADTSSRFYPMKPQEQKSDQNANRNHRYYNDSNYPLEYMGLEQQARNNDYINYTETFDKTYAEEADELQQPEEREQYIGLGYVQLEIVMSQNSTSYYAKAQNKTYERPLSPGGSGVSYGRRLSNQSNRMYTSCDVLRTQALRQTKDEFQRS